MITATSETAIWARVIEADQGNLNPDAARYFLNLQFSAADQLQMHELALGNQEGILTEEEAAALRNFRQIGLQIDLLRSKARLALGATSVTP